MPTVAIDKLSKLKGWAVVLVGDTKTPSNWQHPNCVFLSIEIQKQLGFSTHELLPYGHYTRKTMGYLYAVQHGAETIYETDDDNAFIDGIEENVLSLNESASSEKAYFLDSSIQSVEQFEIIRNANNNAENQITVNPYEYFGESTLWPRGYPLRLIGDELSVDNTRPQLIRPLIQQGLANGDPDMDAIFRLTRSNRHKRISVRFQQKKPVSIPHSLLVPFNSQNTLFHYEAFWGLWIPMTTTFRVCDIWRGYFVQRLLWELTPTATLTFHSPSVLQLRNPHNYLKDFQDELPLY